MACGIGHLLTDEESAQFESKCISTFYLSIERFNTLSGQFLQELQDCHDIACNAGDGRFFMSSYLVKMANIATKYALVYKGP